MSNELVKVFEYLGSKIPTWMDEERGLWCRLDDVCAALGVSDSGNVASALDDDEKKTVRVMDGNRGNPNMLFVSESGFECKQASLRS